MSRRSQSTPQGYREHLALVRAEWESALEQEGFDAAVVPAGEARLHYSDDQGPPFRASPHFLRWVPHVECESAVLLLRPGECPSLFWLKPEDYWYLPTDPPDFVQEHFDLEIFSEASTLWQAVRRKLRGAARTALVGPAEGVPDLSICDEIDYPSLVTRLEYRCAYRTSFELDCVREATRLAVAGHLSAREMFWAGGSEYDIHIAFLQASSQTEADLPYPNIVGLNEHASTLHYQRYERRRAERAVSLLIDAGGRFRGYQSDITRTHAANPTGPFHDLIGLLDAAQQRLIATLEPALSFVVAHERMRSLIAEVLREAELICCTPETAEETGLVDVFFPHGLGHLLGLLTHEAGGHLIAEDRTETQLCEKYPYLRFTRPIEPGQLFTVEPGIYFISMLLVQHRHSSDINWNRVQSLMPYGGVRIEDNVHMLQDGAENLTRRAFAAADIP